MRSLPFLEGVVTIEDRLEEAAVLLPVVFGIRYVDHVRRPEPDQLAHLERRARGKRRRSEAAPDDVFSLEFRLEPTCAHTERRVGLDRPRQ